MAEQLRPEIPTSGTFPMWGKTIKPEIKRRLAALQDAAQPIPDDWWAEEARIHSILKEMGEPPPEIESVNMERKLFIDKEALKEEEIIMCVEAMKATRPKDVELRSSVFLFMVFRVITRFQVRKLLGKYELTEKAQKPWEKGAKPNANNENNISEVDNELV